jgi:hypothetical protein
MGVATLREIEGFTPEGRSFFAALEREIDALLTAVNALAIPMKTPAYEFSKQENAFRPQRDRRSGATMTVREALVEHIEHADASDHARRWLPLLAEQDPLGAIRDLIREMA